MLLATARAGNVIGGGDWSEDRLIPDLIRGFIAGKPVPIRRPLSVRPWQHVLEPITGYLLLAEKLLRGTRVGGYVEPVPGMMTHGRWNESLPRWRSAGVVGQHGFVMGSKVSTRPGSSSLIPVRLARNSGGNLDCGSTPPWNG